MKILAGIFALLASAFIGGCSSTTTVQSNTGNLRGTITLFNASGDTLLNDAGATVWIPGTSFQGTSSSRGDWEIDNIPAGVYNVSFTKPGFDTLVVPQYQFIGAGTSFLLNNAIQAMPTDSLVFSIANSGYTQLAGFNSSGDSIFIYYGSLGVTGGVSGPDSLVQARVTATFADAADSNFNFSLSEYLINNQLTPIEVSVPYTKPPVTSGTIVTVKTYLFGAINQSTEKFANFPQAISPYVVTRTFKIP